MFQQLIGLQWGSGHAWQSQHGVIEKYYENIGKFQGALKPSKFGKIEFG